MSHKKYQKGFGLLEVLVSVVIIITILSAMVFIGRSSLNNSQYAQERAQAIYLAQEGIEIIRQMRDSNWIDGDNTTEWNSWDYDGNLFSEVQDGRCYKINDIITSPLSSPYYGRHNMVYTNLSNKGACKNALKDPTKTGEWGKRTVNNLDYYRNVFIENVSGLMQSADTAEETAYANSAYKITVFVQWINRGSYRKEPVEVSEIITNWRPDY